MVPRISCIYLLSGQPLVSSCQPSMNSILKSLKVFVLQSNLFIIRRLIKCPTLRPNSSKCIQSRTGIAFSPAFLLCVPQLIKSVVRDSPWLASSLFLKLFQDLLLCHNKRLNFECLVE